MIELLTIPLYALQSLAASYDFPSDYDRVHNGVTKEDIPLWQKIYNHLTGKYVTVLWAGALAALLLQNYILVGLFTLGLGVFWGTGWSTYLGYALAGIESNQNWDKRDTKWYDFLCVPEHPMTHNEYRLYGICGFFWQGVFYVGVPFLVYAGYSGSFIPLIGIPVASIGIALGYFLGGIKHFAYSDRIAKVTSGAGYGLALYVVWSMA